MAAVAQQYYEEAAQNEQMGEDEGVSHHLSVFDIHGRGKFYSVIVLLSPGACLRFRPELLRGTSLMELNWRGTLVLSTASCLWLDA